MQPVDVLIISNGPGELVTWVRPVVQQLRQQLGYDSSQVRISVILSPCTHATGKEAELALSYSEVDRVQDASSFWQFLLWGKTAQNWDWRDRGVIIFLGGDQLYSVLIGKRLGYSVVIYAEWQARWVWWADYFGAMKPEIFASIPKRYQHKFTVVGDLITDVSLETFSGQQKAVHSDQTPLELIGLLPGSKAAKLSQGVPLALAVAEQLQQARPQTRFVIPVAPTLDLLTLARFANPEYNPIIPKIGGVRAELIQENDSYYLKTSGGVSVELATEFPAYNVLSRCRLCLTTVGANTAELGALAVPMIVLLPTQQLDAMRAWDGVPGILANLPGVGSAIAKMINLVVLRQNRLFAWPNIWAKEAIVPELVGQLQPKEIAEFALDFLENPEKLEAMRDRLRGVRGKPGAAQKLAELVKGIITKD